MDYFDVDLSSGFAKMSVDPYVLHTNMPIIVKEQANSVNEYGVFTTDNINAGVYLGDIQGERKYSWEIIPNEFILFIDDECIIDMNLTPRDTCAYIREDFFEGLDPNCELVRYGVDDGMLHVGFRTLRNIERGEELVYRRCQELWIEPIMTICD
jgi:hypothetical protein